MPPGIPLRMSSVTSAARFLREDVSAWFAAPNKKPIAQQASEFLELWRAYKTFPYQYLKYDLYARGAGADYLNYVPNVIVDEYVLDINHAEQRAWLEDKLEFDRRAKEIGLPVLEIWTIAGAGPSGIDLRTLDGASLTLDALLQQARRKAASALFFKPRWGTQGISAFKLDVREDGFARAGEKVGAEELQALLEAGAPDEFLVQDYFHQHHAVAAINPQCVNTLRLITLLTDSGVELTGAFFRTGRENRETDNWGTGGYAVGVDVASGRVSPGAKLKHLDGRATLETHHDGSGVAFGDICIPFMEQSVELVMRGAIGFAPIRVIGWDIVFGPDGPFILEGNWLPGFLSVQQVCGGIRETPLVRELAAKLHWR